jgi:hypothetical protein
LTLTRILIAAVILMCSVVLPSGVQAGNLALKAGVGYDYFSQQYFLDSLQPAGADSVLTRFALTSNFLNDFKGMVGLTYHTANSRLFELRAGYEQTSQLLRAKLQSDWHPKLGASRLDWHTELDWRNRYHGNASSGDSYVLGSTTLRYRVPTGASTHLWAQGQADGVSFHDNVAYSYNYWRVGGKIGIDRQLNDLNVVELDGFAVGRQVPDSTSLGYFSGGLESSLFGTFGRLDLDMMARAEWKTYHQADSQGNYTRLEFDCRNRIRLGGSYFGRCDLTSDITWYEAQDPLNADYQRVTLATLGGKDFGGFSLAVGPEMELLREQAKELAEREDYIEVGGEASLDLLHPGGGIASLESVSGRRNIRYPTSILTSYTFQRLSLFSDWTLFGRLNLNILASAEWEWHSDSANNNRLYLISSSLTWRF